MHTRQIGEHVFNFNGDYSGDVLIRLPNDTEVEIPFDVMKQFVADAVVAKRIAVLEQASADEILGISTAMVWETAGVSK